MMNASHAVGGLAATGLTGMLTTVLAYWQHLPADVAASEAGLVVLALGAIMGLVQTLWPHKTNPSPSTSPPTSGR